LTCLYQCRMDSDLSLRAVGGDFIGVDGGLKLDQLIRASAGAFENANSRLSSRQPSARSSMIERHSARPALPRLAGISATAVSASQGLKPLLSAMPVVRERTCLRAAEATIEIVAPLGRWAVLTTQCGSPSSERWVALPFFPTLISG
jgi:hypothetical protein